LKESFVHLCGGEPLVHSAIGDVLSVLTENKCQVLLYTALPYGFDSAIESIHEQFPRVKFRISTSEYIVEHNPAHVFRTCLKYWYLKRAGADVGISGYDKSVDQFPESVKPTRTKSCRSGRYSDSDPLDLGPLMDVVFSDGTVGKERLLQAHYSEAKKSVHKTS
jgi:organic radical activating enzyme